MIGYQLTISKSTVGFEFLFFIFFDKFLKLHYLHVDRNVLVYKQF
jgi:hypothetical protein